MRGENVRFWLPVLALCSFSGYTSYKLVRAHLAPTTTEPRYDFKSEVVSSRGAIYDSTRDPVTGRNYPLVKSTPCWEFRLDPVVMTSEVVRVKGEKPRSREAMARTISQVLHLDYAKTLAMCRDTRSRYQFLKVSSDQRAHDILKNKRYVAGVIVQDTHERRYFEDRHLAHVLGCVNKEGVGSYGIEQRFDKLLRGVPGRIRGKRDGQGREIVEKRVEMTPPVPGADVYLTINRHIQKDAEDSLAGGVAEFGAAAGWCVILDAQSGDVLAMASYPDFDPCEFGKAPESAKINRVTAFTYEPGSVMKVITAAAAIDRGYVRPDSLYSTDRFEKGPGGDPKYYKLPGDGSHVWEPRMSVKDAIVHSSNIVIGKLGYELGPATLHSYMKKFGFGEQTGVELPGEEVGILRPPERWDKATRSRAAIGQGVSVTAIQLASAYQAIANDGVRMPPRIVAKVLNADGEAVAFGPPRKGERVVSVETSRQLREMMLGVASPEGTARRAALRGYSVAGKTGTAQKVRGRTYAPGIYRATFCGIVPSGVVKSAPQDADPVPPRVVILVTLDFEEKRKFHQGGNSAGPVFKRIAQGTLRRLEVAPDRPDELLEYDDEEFERMMESRAKKVAEEDPMWGGEPLWRMD